VQLRLDSLTGADWDAAMTGNGFEKWLKSKQNCAKTMQSCTGTLSIGPDNMCNHDIVFGRDAPMGKSNNKDCDDEATIPPTNSPKGFVVQSLWIEAAQ
jgi:hypothetical protein